MHIDAQALYDALARVLEQREHVKIKIIVREKSDEKDN